MKWKWVISCWNQPSAVFLLIAAFLASVAGPCFLAGVLAAGDASFLYGVFAVAIVLVLAGGAGAAHTGHLRLATTLGAAASTPALGFVFATYAYRQVHTLDGHPFGQAAMLLAAALYLGCSALAAVLAPFKLRIGVEGVVNIVVSTMVMVTVSIFLAFYVLMIVSGGSD